MSVSVNVTASSPGVWNVDIEVNLNDAVHKFFYTVSAANDREAEAKALQALKDELDALSAALT